MGYYVTLKKDGQTTKLNKVMELAGSTYALGGSDIAELSITYNYSALFKSAFKDDIGLYCINGLSYQDGLIKIIKAVSELSEENNPPSIDELKELESIYLEKVRVAEEEQGSAVIGNIFRSMLQDVRERIKNADPATNRARPSYWDATPGNAKQALRELIKMASEAPTDTIWSID